MSFDMPSAYSAITSYASTPATTGLTFFGACLRACHRSCAVCSASQKSALLPFSTPSHAYSRKAISGDIPIRSFSRRLR